MSIEQERMIVESLSSLYPLQEFEERAIDTVLNAIPHWIPVTERLPEIETDVLLTAWDGKRCFVGWVDAFGKWYGDDEEVNEGYEPIAWCALPEPYKGVTT